MLAKDKYSRSNLDIREYKAWQGTSSDVYATLYGMKDIYEENLAPLLIWNILCEICYNDSRCCPPPFCEHLS